MMGHIDWIVDSTCIVQTKDLNNRAAYIMSGVCLFEASFRKRTPGKQYRIC